jgi:hypothetical protein
MCLVAVLNLLSLCYFIGSLVNHAVHLENDEFFQYLMSSFLMVKQFKSTLRKVFIYMSVKLISPTS